MKSTIKKYIPESLLNIRRKILAKKSDRALKRLINEQAHMHKENLKRIQGKEKVKVAFFAIHSSVWKYDYLYRLMVEHPKFDPIIIVCPVVNYGMENMLQEMDKCYQMFRSRNYNVIRTYNIDTQEYLDVKKEINPDIIFYTNPYKGLIDDRYYITNFPNTLTCYAPYGYAISNNENMLFNLPFHNLLWKGFYETDIHKQLAEEFAINKGKNIEGTGYLLFDELDDIKLKIRNDNNIKKIIWAPHHTIEENAHFLGYSCFLKYSEIFLYLRDKYSNDIYWYFKPHPLLKVKLYNHPLWGKKKTDDYYNNWKQSAYSEINEDDYTQLFLESDAMIFDSISFIAEYYYTQKPSIFTIKDHTIERKFNTFGKMAFENIYKAYNKCDIENFINNVVLKGNDPKKNLRRDFFNNILNKKNVSKNILTSLELNIWQKND